MGRESWFQSPGVRRDAVDDVEGRFEGWDDGSGFEDTVGHDEFHQFPAFFWAFLGKYLGGALGQVEKADALLDVIVVGCDVTFDLRAYLSLFIERY